MSSLKTAMYALEESLCRMTERETRRARELALQIEIRDACERIVRLQEAVQRVHADFPDDGLAVQCSPPVDEPKDQTVEALTDYLAELSQSVAQTETQWRLESQRVRSNITLQKSLASLIQTKVQKPRTAAEVLVVSPATIPNDINRLLKRLEREPGEALSPDIERLVQSLQNPQEKLRHSDLTLELRAVIARHNKGRLVERRIREEAKALYLRLPDPRNEQEQQLARRVSEAALGQADLDDRLRTDILDWQTRAKARNAQEQVSEVMRQSLEALGYEVEEGFETLFVSDGQVHAHKPGWGDYALRLRVNPGEQSLDFNLVRADDGMPPTQERRRRDREMEEAWCPDFQRLREQFSAAGLSTRTLREIPAGSLAVQTVPASGATHAPRRATAPVQRTLDKSRGST